MHLLIRAVSLAGQPLTQAISAYFDERGGTIGRSDTNTLALPDPERRISRLQAEVTRSPDGWRILNVGNANPIWHNNRPVPPGEGALLDENDELQIGTYALQVTYSQNDATARTITKGRAAVDSRTVIVSSGQEPRTDPGLMRAADAEVPAAAPSQAPAATPSAPLAPSASPAPASPFADLLGDWSAPAASPVSSPAVAPAAASSPFSQAPHAPAASAASSASPFADLLGFGASSSSSAPGVAPAAPVAKLPDDFDPFADFQSTPSPAARNAPAGGSWDLPKAPVAAPSASPFDLTPGAPALPGDLDLLGSVSPAGAGSIDQLFGLGGGAGSGGAANADPLAAFLKQTEPAAPSEAPAGAPSQVDPLDLLSSRENIRDESARPPTAQVPAQVSALPDDVPELQGAMPLPPVSVRPSAGRSTPPVEPPPVVEVPAQPASGSGAREPLSASFSFMAPRPSAPAPAAPAASAAPAAASLARADQPQAPAAGSPFADLGLGRPAPSGGLLDDLDLSPQTVPSVRSAAAPPAEPVAPEATPLDLDMPVGHAPVAEPLLTQLPTPQTAVPHAPFSPWQADAPAPGPGTEPPPARAAALAPGQGGATPTKADMPASTQADNQALWAAFCEGSGVHFIPPQGLNPDLMRVIGQLLHHAVDGSLKLVAARAATKQEMRAEVTVIQARRNNPLKFSPDTQSAMEQLLQPPLRGFMSGPEAVADAMDDLVGHTIGTMVGMRAALDGVLARFEPEQLESKLVGRSMLDSLLPMNRRAKLWELYLQHYEAVRAEAQDDFHNLFGRAFLQAYEEQLDRLEADRRHSGRTPTAPHTPA